MQGYLNAVQIWIHVQLPAQNCCDRVSQILISCNEKVKCQLGALSSWYNRLIATKLATMILRAPAPKNYTKSIVHQVETLQMKKKS